ncbi:MAG: hypothetical protein AB8B48_04850 [Pseudomonadales bacterium]
MLLETALKHCPANGLHKHLTPATWNALSSIDKLGTIDGVTPEDLAKLERCEVLKRDTASGKVSVTKQGREFINRVYQLYQPQIE